jgi:hypothetical protein
MTDFGMTPKVRPALLLTGNPTSDELDLVTVLRHATSLRGNLWELNISKPFLKPGAFHLQQIQTISTVIGEHNSRNVFFLPDCGKESRASQKQQRFLKLNLDGNRCFSPVLLRSLAAFVVALCLLSAGI